MVTIESNSDPTQTRLEYVESLVQSEAKREIDKPLQGTTEKEADKHFSMPLSPLMITKLESERQTRKYGYDIIKICFWVLAIILISENIVSLVLTKTMSPLNSVALDLLKTIFLFVLGYLFGKNSNAT